MSRYAAFAAGVVLVAASDWALVAPNHPDLPPICATTEAICHEAVPTERWSGRGDPVHPVVNPVNADYTRCLPYPYCRERSMGRQDCIVGFDCGYRR